MLAVAPLGLDASAELAELASRDDVVRFGDHEASDPPSTWGAWLGPPDTRLGTALGAWEDGALRAAAKLTLASRRRRAHVAELALLAGDGPEADGALDALVRALAESCDRWLQVTRTELSVPLGHRRIDGLLADHGFVVETERRSSLRTDGALVDEAGLARLRPGSTPATASAPPPSPPSGTRAEAVIVRPLSPRDAPAMARQMSEEAVCWGTLQVPHQRTELWRDRITTNDPDRILVLGAEVDRELAGSGSLVIGAVARRRHVASLGMAVATRFQGRGVGRRLLDALLEEADARGLSRVELTVYPDNPRAVRLYEGVGFVREGRQRLAAYRDGGLVDDLAMARVRPG
ncbi:MAG TPA: GNAT family N-acetyltransferase [Sandaracinaceae bacterium LLY-WYZ-13_1]|nr:GNAT family N-acetyltransferase [Sandaracinaceae bacterium LLY-WYZ-13_1]